MSVFSRRLSSYLGSTIIDLGTLGGESSLAHSINDSGEIVGRSKTGDTVEIHGYELQVQHAFLWKDNRLIDLGTLGGPSSIAWDINNRGLIVGEAQLYIDLGEIATRAAIWCDAVAIDLNDLIAPDAGWQLWRANAINDAGQIVGVGFKYGYWTHAFLLTPVPCPSCPPDTSEDVW